MKIQGKFLVKAKRKDNNEWVEGYYVYDGNSAIHLIFSEYYVIDTIIVENDEPELKFEGIYEINPETICRLVYKDNEKEIWENDIVEIWGSVDVGVIKWKDENITLEIYTYDREGKHCIYERILDKDYLNRIKTIGNIFDNPELLY